MRIAVRCLLGFAVCIWLTVFALCCAAWPEATFCVTYSAGLLWMFYWMTPKRRSRLQP